LTKTLWSHAIYGNYINSIGYQAMILLCWWSKMRVNAVKATFLLVALLVLAFHPSLSEGSRPPQRRIVFVRNSMIWLANLDGTNIRKLVKGEDPNISSDGAKVAFTMLPWGGRNTERYIAVADVATGAMKVFKGTPSDNSFRPVWSSDGSRISSISSSRTLGGLV
jgi:hypothetical protein